MNCGESKKLRNAHAKSNPQMPVVSGGKSIDTAVKRLFDAISPMIAAARERVAVAVNTELTSLNWNIGSCINREMLGHGRAEYGKRVVKGLASRLMLSHGSGWDEKTLRHCLRVAETFSEDEIVSATRRQLSWTHIKTLAYVSDGIKRQFYLEMCATEHWGTRVLQSRIASMMYERTAIAKRPASVIKKELAALRNEGRMSADLAFRDPYVLDFLGLHGDFSEKELERALVADMRNAILELGSDMAFLAEQKRISVDNEDYYLDLLFFHRRLRRLVAIDLKIDNFKAEYKGQMELYLKWLEKNERRKGENKPVGLILCAGKNEEHVELLELGRSNIRVASYMTELPPKKVLEARLRTAIEAARNRLCDRSGGASGEGV